MVQAGNVIKLYDRTPAINELLKEKTSGTADYSVLYNQNEEMYLALDGEFTVPSFPVHHDAAVTAPDKAYQKKAVQLLEQLFSLAPQAFQGLEYFFSPLESLRLGFCQLFKAESQTYLYLLKADLLYRPGQGEIIRAATNDSTEEYRSSKLFVEADIIPLKEILRDGNIPVLIPEENISQTWIGQRGKGYRIQGIWIDAELTKFFSKLFLPGGLRTYPYYPFSCRYKTICHTPVDFSLRGRKRHLAILARVYPFLAARIPKIEAAMKQEDFSEELPIYQSIRKEVPESWREIWKNLKVEPFLNERDMKEFRIDFE